MDTDTIDALAQEIRRVDGSHSLGAGALAESLAPFIDRLAALPKQDGWQPIESAPKGVLAQFWIEPKRVGDEGVICNTSGEPILSNASAYSRLCEFGDWGSLVKATFWAPIRQALPPPPTVAEREGES